MRFSVPRLGMIWGNIGHQRGKVIVSSVHALARVLLLLYLG